jgi:hypothetical protein
MPKQRSLRTKLVVGGMEAGRATFKNEQLARAWARSVGVAVSDGRKKKRTVKRKRNRTKCAAKRKRNRTKSKARSRKRR